MGGRLTSHKGYLGGWHSTIPKIGFINMCVPGFYSSIWYCPWAILYPKHRMVSVPYPTLSEPLTVCFPGSLKKVEEAFQAFTWDPRSKRDVQILVAMICKPPLSTTPICTALWLGFRPFFGVILMTTTEVYRNGHIERIIPWGDCRCQWCQWNVDVSWVVHVWHGFLVLLLFGLQFGYIYPNYTFGEKTPATMAGMSMQWGIELISKDHA